MMITTGSPIGINARLLLQPIKVSDQKKLSSLMMDIYRPVYQHLWFDDGSYYVDSQFNTENLTLELAVSNAPYYFIIFEEAPIGILRFINHLSTPTGSIEPSVKLHRIYLAPSAHGKGVGKKVIQWLSQEAHKNKQQYIWLECMDTRLSAYNFYKHLGFKLFEQFTLDSPKMRREYRGMLRMKLEVNGNLQGC
ncbi:GNAT family N-acetyltransferase [Nonlabens antarcticus]|uniref:GNAT family N-acetyltransferase n=1 Tax=Nonlabens antarcticus TaxID=392714 RepID=UPI001891EDD9|nr:GNAT family N-acetyltransferase [Nonlabens antarcticus]